MYCFAGYGILMVVVCHRQVFRRHDDLGANGCLLVDFPMFKGDWNEKEDLYVDLHLLFSRDWGLIAGMGV